MFCRFCGTKNMEGAKFCKSCGKGLQKSRIHKKSGNRKVQESYLVVALMMIFLLVLYVAINQKDDKDKIVGSWQVVKLNGEYVDIDGEMTFYEDGTLYIDSLEMKYLISDGKIAISGYSSGLSYNSYICDYYLDGDILIIYEFDGGDIELERE